LSRFRPDWRIQLHYILISGPLGWDVTAIYGDGATKKVQSNCKAKKPQKKEIACKPLWELEPTRGFEPLTC